MTEPKVTQRQELSQEDYVEEARKRLLGFGEAVKDLAQANEALVEGVGDQEYTFTGQVAFRSYVLYTEIDALITVIDGTKLHYKGKAWGVGAGGGATWGGGTFGYVPPSEVIGDCTFELHSISNGIQVNWLRGSKFLGTYLGAGVAISLGIFGGSGRWDYQNE